MFQQIHTHRYTYSFAHLFEQWRHSIVHIKLFTYLLTFSFSFLDPDWWFVSPFLIIGITLLVFGVFFILVFLDICCRLASNLKRVQDPEVDKVDNLHLIKHWMEPGIMLISITILKSYYLPTYLPIWNYHYTKNL